MTDWAAPASRQLTAEGTKAQQLRAFVDRQHTYRAWRRRLGDGLYVNDIDQLEWRAIDGAITPVAVLELTRIDGGSPTGGYLANILARMRARDPQALVACEVASRCGTDAFVVAWVSDCSEFWVYNLSESRDWRRHTPSTYRRWLKELR